MKNKLLLIGLVFIGFVAVTIALNSCFLIDEVSICNVAFRGKEISTPALIPPDTLTNHIAFTVTAQSGIQTCNIWKSLNPISSCYATSKGTKWLNDLDTSTFELSVDTSLTIQGSIISANSDLLSNPTIKLFSTITKEQISPHSIDYFIDFHDTLKTLIEFKERIYNVKFNCRTTDGRDIKQEVKVIFK